jgi:hypothetical protein
MAIGVILFTNNKRNNKIYVRQNGLRFIKIMEKYLEITKTLHKVA